MTFVGVNLKRMSLRKISFDIRGICIMNNAYGTILMNNLLKKSKCFAVYLQLLYGDVFYYYIIHTTIRCFHEFIHFMHIANVYYLTLC